MGADGLELSAVAQDVGEAHESVEAKFEGSELTVAFNAQFLLDGIEAAGSTEVVIETIDPLKPAVMRPAVGRVVRLPVPAHAGPHRLSPRSCTCRRSSSPTSAATATCELDSARGVTVIVGANGEGKTSLLEAVGWVASARSFRGVPDAALVRDRAKPGDPAGRGRRRRAPAVARGRAAGGRPQPGAARTVTR